MSFCDGKRGWEESAPLLQHDMFHRLAQQEGNTLKVFSGSSKFSDPRVGFFFPPLSYLNWLSKGHYR